MSALSPSLVITKPFQTRSCLLSSRQAPAEHPRCVRFQWAPAQVGGRCFQSCSLSEKPVCTTHRFRRDLRFCSDGDHQLTTRLPPSSPGEGGGVGRVCIFLASSSWRAYEVRSQLCAFRGRPRARRAAVALTTAGAAALMSNNAVQSG